MTAFSATDHAMMARALRLAERGAWTTRPNPMVGCVLAHGDAVVGEGWHRRAGGPHAEVVALRDAGERARGATAWVTLEPCAHHGRTPPCSEALVAAGVARVVCALGDPFDQVAGRGLQTLQAHGIEVACGLFEAQARELNRGFLSRIERGRPWLRVKLAMSLDGRTALASGESKWITSAASRDDVQQWRARAGAIISSGETLRADDARLTTRVADETAATLRVIVTRSAASLPSTAALWRERGPVLVVHADRAEPRALPADVAAEVEWLALPGPSGEVALPALLAELGRRGINEAQVEAGPRLAGALLAEGLVDELLVYQAPLLLGEHGRPLLGGISPARMDERIGLHRVDLRQVGADLRMRFMRG